MELNFLKKENDIQSDFHHDKCDKYDYLIAAGCGAVAGLIDIFLIGAPTDSIIQPWTDNQINKVVMQFAKLNGWNPRESNSNNIKSAIGFLERNFPVNYDQKHSGDIDNLFYMSARNHHMKSLAHSPSIIGLFFSILDQFTSTSSFLSDGKLITVQTESYKLRGHDLTSKLFCGITNWFGHIMSDIAGSSGSKERGSGIVIPFYELFGLCNFGNLKVGQHRNTLAKVATKVFENGYDARFGISMSMPVIICDLSIKLIWSLKQHFYHGRPLHECIPSMIHNDLRIMLIVGEGILCLMDGIDAAIRSGGNWVVFFLRLNLCAWLRLILLILKEVYIRIGLSSPLQKQLRSFIIINQELQLYLEKLKKIDIDRFKMETEQYIKLVNILDNVKSEYELTKILKNRFLDLGIELPYQGEFSKFMLDESSSLTFK